MSDDTLDRKNKNMVIGNIMLVVGFLAIIASAAVNNIVIGLGGLVVLGAAVPFFFHAAEKYVASKRVRS